MNKLLKPNLRILKVAGLVNRMDSAPPSLLARVEAELVAAAKELTDAEANSGSAQCNGSASVCAACVN